MSNFTKFCENKNLNRFSIHIYIFSSAIRIALVKWLFQERI